MDLQIDAYKIDHVDQLVTPALVVYPKLVDANIRTTLEILGNDPNRWRPHIKTAKMRAILDRLIGYGVVNFKCSITLELLTACQAGAADVLLAFPVVGANAHRTLEIADRFASTRISVLVETSGQAAAWRGTRIGIFIDINPGMDRTGIGQDRIEEIVELARKLGKQFRGLHYYDGHMSTFDRAKREKDVHEGYDHLLSVVNALKLAALNPREVITSGTPAMPFAMTYPGFRDVSFIHRVSPGTVVFNDTTTLQQLPHYNYLPAAIVVSTVVSNPLPNLITCDAGHKSVSADAGVPTCAVVGHRHLTPLKPSEEHLPMQSQAGDKMPAIGDKLYLVPRHVCPSVNNFDQALFVVDGEVRSIEQVTARGHESPLVIAEQKVAV